VPAAGRQEFVKPNHQVSRDERDALYSLLPRIHVATFKLLASMLHRFGAALLSVLPSLTEQLAWVFKAERADERFRTTAYAMLSQLLNFVGNTFGKDEVTDVAPLIASCCFDLLPEDDQTRLPTASNGVKQPGALAASQTAKPTTVNTAQTSALQNAASALLPVILSKLDPKAVPRKLRASIDRTAILTKHKQALVASVLNPPVNPSGTAAQASLLPFLARLFPGDTEVEAIIRPRMPVTWTGRRTSGEESDDEEDEEEDEEADDMDVDGGALPETDLLSALDEQLGNSRNERPASEEIAEMAEDTTATLPPNLEITTSKRAALNAPEPATPAKRLRASPVAEAIANAMPQDLPGPDPVTARGPVPTTVVTRSAKKAQQQAVTLPAQAAPAPAAATEEADDGSDFEMPPLTMESSGDEDEGEEEEDDA
jgi:pre-rRNA-processing protein RIX1